MSDLDDATRAAAAERRGRLVGGACVAFAAVVMLVSVASLGVNVRARWFTGFPERGGKIGWWDRNLSLAGGAVTYMTAGTLSHDGDTSGLPPRARTGLTVVTDDVEPIRLAPQLFRNGWFGWTLPLWLVALPPAIAGPILWLRADRRRQVRLAGLCAACGYDLRATPTRCPECGTTRA